MHHRTSTDSIHHSMCDIGFCILLARKITTRIIAHRPIRYTSRCAISVFCISWPENHNIDRSDSPVDVRYLVLYLLYISWPEKSQHASSHIDRSESPVDVRYRVLYLLARKITTCIIAHRPIRFASRCAISGFVFTWQDIEDHHNMHHF